MSLEGSELTGQGSVLTAAGAPPQGTPGGPFPGYYGSAPPAIAAAGSAGSSALAARGDHTHAGVTSVNGLQGVVTVTAFPGFGTAPPAVATASAAGAAATASRSDHTHALDIVAYAPSVAGMQAAGVIQQTYSAPTATPAVLTMVAGQVPYGVTGGLLTQSTGLTFQAAATPTLVVSGVPVSSGARITLDAATDANTPAFRYAVAGTVWFSITGSRNGTTAFMQHIMIPVGNQDHFDMVYSGQTRSVFNARLAAAGRDVAMGHDDPITSTQVNGYVWLPVITGTPTAVPDYSTSRTGSRVPVALSDNASGPVNNLWTRDQTAGVWHYVHFNDYTPVATRLQFGGATAGSSTDSANLTFSSNTLFSPTFQGTAVQGDVGGGAAITIYNSSGDAAHVGLSTAGVELKGDTVPSATGTYKNGTSAKIWTQIYATTHYAGTVTGFGGGNTLTIQNNDASPLSSVTLTATDVQVTVPAVSGLVPTASNTSIGTAANYWGGGFIGGIHCLSIQAGDSSGIAMQGLGGSVVLVIDDDSISITPAPGLQAEEATGAQALTIGNGPTATGGGAADKYFKVQKAGTTYVIPAWAI